MQELIFDMHGHIFPAKISEKAVAAIGDFYDLDMEIGGSPEEILEDGLKAGISRMLVCSTATTAHQVEAIDNFVASETLKHPEFVGFGSIHPDYPDIAKEIDRMISLGLRGVKLHPDFQKFNIDDEKAMPIYEACEGRLPILFHTGDDRYSYSAPGRLLKVVERFPKLTVIAAHLGGYRAWDEARVYYGHPRVYIDTSSSLFAVPPDKAVEIIRNHGVERTFFGCDSPMWSHSGELARFNKLRLTPEERKAILWDNAAAFLKM